jgi:predicted RNase H-like nuclease
MQGPEALIAIDIPIGLPEHEPRACDIAARRELSLIRGSSVFPAPARHAIYASTFEEAQTRNREALRVGMSIQAYCIMPKIAGVGELMTPERQRYIREVHPEVTFARLNGGAPMIQPSKSTRSPRMPMRIVQTCAQCSKMRTARFRTTLPRSKSTLD